MLLQSQAPTLYDRLFEPDGVRTAGGISLGGCQPNRVQAKRAYPSSTLIADLSQVLAIVAAGLLPNPLLHEADIIVGSTHKSLNGPQKAIAATNDFALYSLLKAYCSTFISSNHMASVAALAVCLCEFEKFGKAYATQLVANANVIGTTLLNSGIPVYVPIGRQSVPLTETQHIWIDCELLGWDAEKAVRALYEIGRAHV